MVGVLVIMIGIMLSNMVLHHAVLMEGHGVTMSIKILNMLVSKGMDNIHLCCDIVVVFIILIAVIIVVLMVK